ncbi:hypothetical protein ABVK25_009399 [Lepraria finkii]|uniref:Uncharacterized protein n=1 Tax=Lepraria finkii TaxID=1340010 RepID=A0ABR4AXC3_9LECA
MGRLLDDQSLHRSGKRSKKPRFVGLNNILLNGGCLVLMSTPSLPRPPKGIPRSRLNAFQLHDLPKSQPIWDPPSDRGKLDNVDEANAKTLRTTLHMRLS